MSFYGNASGCNTIDPAGYASAYAGPDPGAYAGPDYGACAGTDTAAYGLANGAVCGGAVNGTYGGVGAFMAGGLYDALTPTMVIQQSAPSLRQASPRATGFSAGAQRVWAEPWQPVGPSPTGVERSALPRVDAPDEPVPTGTTRNLYEIQRSMRMKSVPISPGFRNRLFGPRMQVPVVKKETIRPVGREYLYTMAQNAPQWQYSTSPCANGYT